MDLKKFYKLYQHINVITCLKKEFIIYNACIHQADDQYKGPDIVGVVRSKRLRWQEIPTFNAEIGTP